MRVFFEYLKEDGSHAMRRGKLISVRNLRLNPVVKSSVPQQVVGNSDFILVMQDDTVGGAPRQFYSARIRNLRKETALHRIVHYVQNKLPGQVYNPVFNSQ